MPIAASVLILDDGELDALAEQLKRLGADHVRLSGEQIAGSIQQPRDLLITSGKRSLDMPKLEAEEGAAAPTWISVHSQDFLPLRERMRNLGVNFLVHTSLDLESLRLFLLQMLHRGSERRSSRRLPVGAEITLVTPNLEKEARLIEVSTESCQILSAESPDLGEPISLVLPSSMSNGVRCELHGTVLRTTLSQTRSGERAYATVVQFGELETPVREALAKMARGEQIGTPVSPLAGAESGLAEKPEVETAAPESEVVPPEGEAAAEADDRRRAPRNVYERQVLLLEDAGGDGARLGCDLSHHGVRVRGCSALEVGTKVTLALFGSGREEPVVVAASVARLIGDDEVAFEFRDLDDGQHAGLETLSRGLVQIDALDGDGAVVVTKVVAGE